MFEQPIKPKPVKPAPGQESVWDYPRPPLIEPTDRKLVIKLDGHRIASTTRAWRVCETSHPPVYFFPPEDVEPGNLRESSGSTACEWKGDARYFDLLDAAGTVRLERVAFSYPDPVPAFEPLRNHLAFYAAPILAAGGKITASDEAIRPQDGEFYAGWITSDLAGPFKGGPGTWGW